MKISFLILLALFCAGPVFPTTPPTETGTGTGTGAETGAEADRTPDYDEIKKNVSAAGMTGAAADAIQELIDKANGDPKALAALEAELKENGLWDFAEPLIKGIDPDNIDVPAAQNPFLGRDGKPLAEGVMRAQMKARFQNIEDRTKLDPTAPNYLSPEKAMQERARTLKAIMDAGGEQALTSDLLPKGSLDQIRAMGIRTQGAKGQSEICIGCNDHNASTLQPLPGQPRSQSTASVTNPNGDPSCANGR